MSGERLVLKSKATGKIASRADQGKKAITLKAVELTTGCKVMGIPSLLVPQTSKEKAEIAAIGNKYDACFVKVRAGKKSGASDKKSCKLHSRMTISLENLRFILGDTWGTLHRHMPFRRNLSADG